ncbi:MAG TPA: hypothetical protein VIL51_01370 [Thermoleophilia bacterium]
MRLLRGISSRGRVALRPRTFGLLGHHDVLVVFVPNYEAYRVGY